MVSCEDRKWVYCIRDMLARCLEDECRWKVGNGTPKGAADVSGLVCKTLYKRHDVITASRMRNKRRVTGFGLGRRMSTGFTLAYRPPPSRLLWKELGPRINKSGSPFILYNHTTGHFSIAGPCYGPTSNLTRLLPLELVLCDGESNLQQLCLLLGMASLQSRSNTSTWVASGVHNMLTIMELGLIEQRLDSGLRETPGTGI